jgi:Fic family protein
VNERQRLLINKLFDGFNGKLTSSKWAKIAKCSADTALRDINDLLQKKCCKKNPEVAEVRAMFCKCRNAFQNLQRLFFERKSQQHFS